MSAQEMEAMDNEVMGMVNDHAAPEAVKRAEEISKDTAAKESKMGETDDKYWITKKQFAEIAAEAEAEKRRKTMTAVVICALVAISLLAVMAKPDLLIWLVNVGVVCCSVIAGIALDRWWNR